MWMTDVSPFVSPISFVSLRVLPGALRAVFAVQTLLPELGHDFFDEGLQCGPVHGRADGEVDLLAPNGLILPYPIGDLRRAADQLTRRVLMRHLLVHCCFSGCHRGG